MPTLCFGEDSVDGDLLDLRNQYEENIKNINEKYNRQIRELIRQREEEKNQEQLKWRTPITDRWLNEINKGNFKNIEFLDRFVQTLMNRREKVGLENILQSRWKTEHLGFSFIEFEMNHLFDYPRGKGRWQWNEDGSVNVIIFDHDEWISLQIVFTNENECQIWDNNGQTFKAFRQIGPESRWIPAHDLLKIFE